ncbi:type IV pili methyl-accepting chemotaxis transducer N-terminal domain-containing protein [Cognatiyoonia sp. IB215446]|uniref:type IV pili methyl-accepting chemotaxis transducer N-terminal domain-containing protein n=1 Tax=Cognatiyoonia sp. IB215446 TaxID=3097355 RepID=UPI002A1777E6|nr:type IV pili methyl-accepting chemotaxis transducer N-terminal domain-containing protein [Cognatiyoonia sp. IB215446]MDX8346731.1 type IV pili methyl-accepting chemotaxis transducer N-terminal domain-containing protein [Cognatiyoonia sp. IB215446]
MLRSTRSPGQLFGAKVSSFIWLGLLCTPLQAEQVPEAPPSEIVNYEIESDGADRILLAGKLRTLTQQVAASSCAVTSGVDVEEAHDVLAQATADFDRYIAALRDGDDALHILGPEKNARIVRDLDHVLAEWSAIHGAVDKVIADDDDVESAHIIDDHNLKLLELTTILSSDIVGRYAHPYEMTSADAMMIEIAGRQLMLTQKMAKDSCEVWTGYHAEAAKEDLAATMQIFETSLNALRFGMPEAGLQAAPNDIIRQDLDILLARWDIIKVNQQTLVDGGELTEDQKYEIFHDLQVELADLEHLLEDYRDHSERAH